MIVRKWFICSRIYSERGKGERKVKVSDLIERECEVVGLKGDGNSRLNL